MRERKPRHGRIDKQPYLHRHTNTRSIVAAYGLVLLIPVLLWIIENPMLVGGVITFIAGTYTLIRIGAWAAHSRLWTQHSVCIPGTEICIKT